MLEARHVSFSYGEKQVLRDVNLILRDGEMLGVIGPNGSGKSSLVKVLTGVLRPEQGEVYLDGCSIWAYKRKELARRVAVLTQDPLPPVDFSVRAVVEMGRYPHQSWWGTEEGEGWEELLASVCEATGIYPLLDRPLSSLSGGERQRVAIAKAMVQQPRYLFLDEPTTFLDIGFQVQTLQLVRKWQKQSGLSVLIVLHDLNMAAQLCDRILLLHRGEIVASGSPWDVIQPEYLRQTYGVEAIVTAHPHMDRPQLWVKME
jgi:iron complex transport system ATP-binding protein